MKMNKLATAVALFGAFGFAGSVSAFQTEDLIIDTGSDMWNQSPLIPDDGDTLTESFYALGLFPNATSIYTGEDNGVLTAGEVLNFTDTGTVNVGELVPLANAASPLQAQEYLGDTWTLTATYSVGGTAVYVGPDVTLADVPLAGEFADLSGFIPTFTSGTIDFAFNDTFGLYGLGAGNSTKVMQLDLAPPVTGVAPGNILLEGQLNYDWYTPGAPPAIGEAGWLVENMFSFEDSGESFYELAGLGMLDVLWRSDFNADPNLIPYNKGGLGNVSSPLTAAACGQGEICRTTNLNMTIEFSEVPVPGTLALIGLGLLGLGVGSRKKRVMA